MFTRVYKAIIDKMPAGVFAFDRKGKILFTNAAFSRSFPETAKRRGTLKDVIACEEGARRCGESENCAYCAFHKAICAAIEKKTEQTETAYLTLRHDNRTDKLALRIRIYPADEKGKLFLGLTDGSYQTELAREMLSAQKMQQRLLPAGKVAGGIPYSYTYIPCLEIGGDMPDVYELNGKTYGVVADVSGKGVSAGMLSAFFKAGYDKKEPSIARALDALNSKFCELKLDERSYITVVAVAIDRAKKEISYVSAGHNAPILLKTADGINEIEFPAPPISDWMPHTYAERSLVYEKGDILALITDGVTECANSAGELFGIERVESVLLQSGNANDFIGKLRSALSVFSGGKFTDDITALAFDL